MFQDSCFGSGLKVQPSILFYVSSFMFLVLLKSSACNGVLCFKFHVSGLAQNSAFNAVSCFNFCVLCFKFHVSVAAKASQKK